MTPELRAVLAPEPDTDLDGTGHVLVNLLLRTVGPGDDETAAYEVAAIMRHRFRVDTGWSIDWSRSAY